MKNYFGNVRKALGNMADKVTKYDWGKEVAPGVTALETPGHTPGHTSFAVTSGNAKMLVQSDVTNIPEFFLRNPDWHVTYDSSLAGTLPAQRQLSEGAKHAKNSDTRGTMDRALCKLWLGRCAGR